MIDGFLLARSFTEGRATAMDDWGWARCGDHIYATKDVPAKRIRLVTDAESLRSMRGIYIYLGPGWSDVCGPRELAAVCEVRGSRALVTDDGGYTFVPCFEAGIK